MTKIVSRLVGAAAAAGLVFAPVAAQAGTRAGDSGAIYKSSGSSLNLQEEESGFIGDAGKIFLALIAAGLVIWGIERATDSDGGQSPGT